MVGYCGHVTNYPRLMRIPGASGFMVSFAIAALLAGVRSWWEIGLTMVLGLVFHAAGFADNEWADRERDKKGDEIPSNVVALGLVSPTAARNLVAGLIAVGLGLFVLIVSISRAWWTLPLWGLVTISGLAYNHIGKSDRRAGLLFYLGGTALPVVVVGVAWAGALTLPLELLAALLLPSAVYGLLVGDGKDLVMPAGSEGEDNLWRRLHAKVKDGRLTDTGPLWGALLGLGLLIMVIGDAVILETGWGLYFIFPVILFTLFYMLAVTKLAEPRPWDKVREKALGQKVFLVATLLVMVPFVWMVGWETWLLLFAFGVAWQQAWVRALKLQREGGWSAGSKGSAN